METATLKNPVFRMGDKVKISPAVTGMDNWVSGEIIDIEQNPFTGTVISLKDKGGRIFTGQKKYIALV
jgi:hypothetical protein